MIRLGRAPPAVATPPPHADVRQGLPAVLPVVLKKFANLDVTPAQRKAYLLSIQFHFAPTSINHNSILQTF